MSLKLDGVQDTLNKLKNVNNKITREIDRELRAGANDIEREAKRLAPANFGELRKSIGTRKEGFLRYAIFANAYHAPYIEFGTRAKVQVPAEMSEVAAAVKSRPKRGTWEEFIQNIKEWMKKKGIGGTAIVQVKSGKRKGQFKKASKKVQDEYLNNAAYLIAREIYKNGISPQPFLYPAFIKNKAKLISRIQEILKRTEL